jgi:hypothetical protein
VSRSARLTFSISTKQNKDYYKDHSQSVGQFGWDQRYKVISSNHRMNKKSDNDLPLYNIFDGTDQQHDRRQLAHAAV